VPVRKFRSVEDMKPTWYEPGDPALVRAVAVIWAFGRHGRPPRAPGVTRFRSYDELCDRLDDIESEHVRALRARQPIPPEQIP
jgi:hypothetical protein